MEETLLRHGLPLAALFVLASSAGIPTGVPVKAVLLTAGALLGAAPAACLWVGVPFGLGWTFRDDVATLETALRSAAGPIVAAVAVAAAGTVAVRVAMNRRATARTVR